MNTSNAIEYLIMFRGDGNSAVDVHGCAVDIL